MITPTNILSCLHHRHRALLGLSLAEAAVLLAALAVGVFFRTARLAGLGFYWDETYATHAAIGLMNGEPLKYTRALLPVTLPVLLAFETLSVSWTTARLPMLLLNLLGALPLWFVAKRFGRAAAVVAVCLYLTNPFIIAVGRTVREYAVMPGFYYLVLLCALNLAADAGPSLRDVARRQWPSLLGVLALAAYCLLVDLRSNFVLSMVFVLLAAVVLLARQVARTRNPAWALGPLALFLGGGALLAWRFYALQQIDGQALKLGFSPTYLANLVGSASQHNYWLAQVGYAVLAGVLALVWLHAIRRPVGGLGSATLRDAALVGWGLLLILLAISLLYGNGIYPARPRYGILVEILLPLMIAILLEAGLGWLPAGAARWRQPLRVAIVLVLFVNPVGLREVYRYQKGAEFSVTGDYHFDPYASHAYLAKAMQAGEPLVTDRFYWLTDEMLGNQWPRVAWVNITPLADAGPAEIGSVLPDAPHGWVALYPSTKIEIDRYFKPKDFTSGNKRFHFYGKMGDVRVWDWSLR